MHFLCTIPRAQSRLDHRERAVRLGKPKRELRLSSARASQKRTYTMVRARGHSPALSQPPIAAQSSKSRRRDCMELRLNDQEKRLLLEILEERYRNLIHEIARTDHRDFKHELQARCSVIEGILKRVQAQEKVPV